MSTQEIWKDLKTELADPVWHAERLEVFADFVDSEGSELPVFAYGIKVYHKQDGDTYKEPLKLIFESGSEGCLVSEIADRRRSATVNAVIFSLNRLLAEFHSMGKSIEVTVRTGMQINGIILPYGFKIALK